MKFINFIPLNDADAELTTDTYSKKPSAKLTVPRGYGTVSTNGTRTMAYYSGGGDLNLYRSSDLENNIIDIFEFATDTICVKCNSRMVKTRVGHQGATV